MTVLAGVALVGFLGLGVWSPWRDSDHPGLWLVLTGACALGFMVFGAHLGR